MKEKLALLVVFVLGFTGVLLWIGEAPSETRDIVNRIVGTGLLIAAYSVYKHFERKGVIEEDNKVI